MRRRLSHMILEKYAKPSGRKENDRTRTKQKQTCTITRTNVDIQHLMGGSQYKEIIDKFGSCVIPKKMLLYATKNICTTLYIQIEQQCF